MPPADDRTLYVPLRSNAHQLLAGAPAAAIRRKLKYASLVYDRIYLEEGALLIQAGEGGSFTSSRPGEDAEFQTARHRAFAMRAGFSFAIGDDATSDTPAPMRTLSSWDRSAIAWEPTLEPILRELPDGCDWVQPTAAPRHPEVTKLANAWSRPDLRNQALQKAIPESFARSLIVDHANLDLARAAVAGTAVMQDPHHLQVIQSRLDTTTEWQPIGFAAPVLAPRIGDLPWGEIAAVRADKALRSYRSMLRDLESEALEQAGSDTDIEGVLHRLMERRLSELASPPDGYATRIFSTARSFYVGLGIGALTLAWSSPTTQLIGGAALGTVFEVAKDARSRGARRWVSLHQRLT